MSLESEITAQLMDLTVLPALPIALLHRVRHGWLAASDGEVQPSGQGGHDVGRLAVWEAARFVTLAADPFVHIDVVAHDVAVSPTRLGLQDLDDGEEFANENAANTGREAPTP